MKKQKQVLTVSCLIQATSTQVAKIDETLQAFADACQHINNKVPEHLTNELGIQSLIYHDVRALFGLSSQMTIHAVRRVCGNRKTALLRDDTVKNFAPTSVTYDARTFSFRETNWTISLTLLGGRERFTMQIGDYQRNLLQGKKPKTATLSKRKNGSYFINIQLESEPPIVAQVDKVLGVDLGRTDIAVTSDGVKYNGRQITEVRDKYAKVRTSIQKKAAFMHKK